MLLLIYLFYLTIAPSLQRTYDIEDESLKNFGSDLKGTVAKFRKSTEYAKILADKLDEIFNRIKDISIHGQYYYNEKYQLEANELAETLRTYIEVPEVPGDDVSVVEILDNHFDQSNIIPVKAKNEARMKGLDYATKIIEDCIASMRSEAGSTSTTSETMPVVLRRRRYW